MNWYVKIIFTIEGEKLFEFDEFDDVITFIKLWQHGYCGGKCDYQIKRSDI